MIQYAFCQDQFLIFDVAVWIVGVTRRHMDIEAKTDGLSRQLSRQPKADLHER